MKPIKYLKVNIKLRKQKLLLLKRMSIKEYLLSLRVVHIKGITVVNFWLMM